MSIFRFARAWSMAALLAASVAAAFAQTYPAKPIKLINPWAPGGAADLIARPIMQRLAEALGQPIVVDNRPGANGTIGAAAAAHAAPDGYTLFFSNVGPVAISPALQTNLPYDSIKDFEPITQLVSGPTVLVVRPDIPVTSMKQLIAYAKAHPGKLSYGSVGSGSTTHLAGEMLSLMAGVELLHVPYKGNAPVVTDLLGGQLSMAFINVAGAMPYLKSGKFRGIAVTTLKRSAALPELPAVAETLPGFEVNSWYGLMAPAGTPKAIIERLYRETVKVLKSPKIVEQMAQAGLDIEGTTPKEHAAQIRSDLERWARVVKATGATVN